MEKMSCDMVNDLLPLYLDGICSEESKDMVEQHIKNCEECRKTLECMQENVDIPEEKDTSIIQKVKRRILIEKLVIVFAVVLVLAGVLLFGGLHLISTQIAMNDILDADDVRVEQDEDGDIWLVRSGNAVYADHEIMEKYTEDGQLIIGMGESEVSSYEGEKIVNMVLLESRMSRITHQILGETSSIEEERNLLFNANEKTDYSKVTITLDGTEMVLWERK